MEPHCDENLDLPPSAQQPPSASTPDRTPRGRRVRTIAGTLRGSHKPLSTTNARSPRLAIEGLVATTAKETSRSHTKNAPPIASHRPCITNHERDDHAPSPSFMPSVSPSTVTVTVTVTVSNPSMPYVPSSIPATTSAAPLIRTLFDPWNSSSTGHQRAENRLSGSTSWRESRNLKLREQYLGGLSGGAKRVADTVGAGSEEFGKDGRKANGGWERGAKGLRGTAQMSLVEVWGASKAGRGDSKLQDVRLQGKAGASDRSDASEDGETTALSSALKEELLQPKRIFEGLCFYLNGSTAPLVGDYKLKQLLAERGANMSIALGRRSVTHVILGMSNSHRGCGGGLAATKIQKEIARTGGKGVKFVSVEWVLLSIAAERRLPESRFASSTTKLAPQNQNSVYGMLRRVP
ncbi:hypothetical protein B0J11DRAFT_440695 [Dendryphion nanum]|uniref:BRCT domain-containing protein n=1 Tax=Dendryphion nanum TaxID=256645 RepID=A0A9P9DHM0_9PLEO|nr:hypothetical protein B0J11DRAFT_440695 [Dendryphion nanum]